MVVHADIVARRLCVEVGIDERGEHARPRHGDQGRDASALCRADLGVGDVHVDSRVGGIGDAVIALGDIEAGGIRARGDDRPPVSEASRSL